MVPARPHLTGVAAPCTRAGMETGHAVAVKPQLRGADQSDAVLGFAIGALVEVTFRARNDQVLAGAGRGCDFNRSTQHIG